MSLPVIVFTLLEDPSPGAALERQSTTVTPGVDWALDPITNDLIIPMRFTNGLEAVVQGLSIRIRTFLGEWFADLGEGLDWDGEILAQKFNDIRIRAEFRRVILKTPGVISIEKLIATWEGDVRTLTVDWEVRGDSGLISGSLEV